MKWNEILREKLDAQGSVKGTCEEIHHIAGTMRANCLQSLQVAFLEEKKKDTGVKDTEYTFLKEDTLSEGRELGAG